MEEDAGSELVYLGAADILGLHAAVLGCTEAEALAHLRDAQALEGALARPLSHAHYQGADIAMQAAVLAHGIAESQPFIDGNKRTALAAMRTFLKLNGHTVRATQQERAAWILGLAHGSTVENLAVRLREVLHLGI